MDLARGHWLDRPVNEESDHILGRNDAPITLVEYGSYACPYCRAANERIAEVRDQLGDRLRYVFRHKPLAGNPLARPAAELVERARDAKSFWSAHVRLMTRSEVLTADDLATVAADLGVGQDDPEDEARAKARVDADEESARASGALITPTFFINGRRYDGPWDDSAFADAMLRTLGHRVRSAALDFASWGPSAGVLLLLATLVAIVLMNSGLGPAFAAFWRQELGVTFDGHSFSQPLGIMVSAFLSVRLRIALKPAEYSWLQLAGAGALAGIGFTMSLFIAGQAFPVEGDFEAAKIAVFAASVLSAVIGVALLAIAGRNPVK